MAMAAMGDPTVIQIGARSGTAAVPPTVAVPVTRQVPGKKAAGQWT